MLSPHRPVLVCLVVAQLWRVWGGGRERDRDNELDVLATRSPKTGVNWAERGAGVDSVGSQGKDLGTIRG